MSLEKNIYRTSWIYIHNFHLKIDLIASEPSRSLEIDWTLCSDPIHKWKVNKLGGYVRGIREKKLTHRLSETEVKRKGAILAAVITVHDFLPWKDTFCKACMYICFWFSLLLKRNQWELLVSGSQATFYWIWLQGLMYIWIKTARKKVKIPIILKHSACLIPAPQIFQLTTF